ncbi:MAG: hypothetical protein ACXVB9_16410 [Bdellovibrionota bacterium]
MRTAILWGMVAFTVSMMFGCAEMPRQGDSGKVICAAPAEAGHAVFLRGFQDPHSQSRGAAL